MPFPTRPTPRLPSRAADVLIDHPLSPGGRTLAVLDANVLLPPRLSDLLFDLCLVGLYHPRWTPAIEGEFIKHFGAVVLAAAATKRKASKVASPNQEHIAIAERRLHCFRSAVGPEHEVLLYDKPIYKHMVPPNVNGGDIHVASAALVLRALAQQEGVAADKVFIISNNLKHLAVKEMAAIGIDVISPGAFINKLNAAAPAKVEAALLKTINDLVAPPYTKADVLTLLVTHGANVTAKFYSSHWSVKIPHLLKKNQASSEA